jgi:tripartite-type tricarboxylate transporter receptor subunit TctC
MIGIDAAGALISLSPKIGMTRNFAVSHPAMIAIGQVRKLFAPLGLGLLLGAFATTGPVKADAVSDFFSRKTVTLIAGFPPGGGYDTYIRVLARHFGKFIPGNPSVVPSNLPGAGSMNLANRIYKSDPNDGTVMGEFASSVVMEPLLGNKAALFDPTKFSWIGSMSQDVAYCGVLQTSGAAATFDDMLKKGGKETIFGGGAPAAITYQHPMILKNVLGAHIRVIPGYAGTRDIDLAMQRGEVNGECGFYASSIKSQFHDDVKSGRMKLVIQMGPEKSTEFGNIPSVYDYARTDEDRAVLDIHFKQLVLGRPLAGPPGIPPDRLKALRDAFAATMKDADFLAEANKVGLDIDYASPEEVQNLLKHFATFSPAIFEKARRAIGR